MFCENCGTKLADGIKFCPACGTRVAVAAPAVEEVKEEVAQVAEAPVEEVSETATETIEEVTAPVIEEPVTAPVVETPAPAVEPAAPAEVKGNSKGALIFGILGLEFSDTGLIGLILSIIGCAKANKFEAMNGKLDGKAKAGKILSIIGIIFSIIAMVAIIAIIAFVVVLGVNGQLDDFSRYIAEIESNPSIHFYY